MGNGQVGRFSATEGYWVQGLSGVGRAGSGDCQVQGAVGHRPLAGKEGCWTREVVGHRRFTRSRGVLGEKD